MRRGGSPKGPKPLDVSLENNNNITAVADAVAEEDMINTYCAICLRDDDEDKLLVCDGTDCCNEIHTYCLAPPLLGIPPVSLSCHTVVLYAEVIAMACYRVIGSALHAMH